MAIKFYVTTQRWTDRVNGNTYHAVQIENLKTGKTIFKSGFTYGYGDHYRQTAIDYLIKRKLLKASNRYNHELIRKTIQFAPPIDGLKREMDTEKVDMMEKLRI